MGKVAVTQEDRDRAYGFESNPTTADLIVTGMRDDHALVQAVATTRIATAEACARIAERETERVRVSAILGNTDPVEAGLIDEALSAIATAIRLQQGSEADRCASQ